MTLKEALRIVKDYGFVKQTVTTSESGICEVFHYFNYSIGDVKFMLSNDDEEEWYGSIFDYRIKFYTPESFADVLDSIEKGNW